MVSPALQDPDAEVEVFVGGVASSQVMRAVLGYATFEVPVSLTGADAEVDVTVGADGVVADQLSLHLKPAVTPAVSAKEDVLAFLDELAEVVAGQQQAGEDFVDQNGGLSADERAIVLGAANAAARQIEDVTGVLEVLLNGEGGEELATILQASLYANGLAELRDSTRTAAKGAGAAAGADGEAAWSPANVCDIYIPAICAIQDARGVLSRWSQVAPGLCTEVNLWLARGSPTALALAYTDGVCAPLMTAMDFAEVLTRFVASMEMDMRLRSNESVIRTGGTATITAEVTFGGLHDLCTDATSGVADKVADKVDGTIVTGITKLLLKKSKRVTLVQKVLKKLRLPDSLLLAGIDKSVEFAVTRLRLDGVFRKATDALCGNVRFDGVGEERVAVLQADGQDFNLQASNDALLTRNDDGSGTYSLACPAGFSGTLVVKGRKDLCGKQRKGEVRVSCGSACSLALHEEVKIPDPALRRLVERELSKAPGEPIRVFEMEGVFGIGILAPAKGIKSLSGLECATNLEALNLNFNDVTDVSPLSGLPSLDSLRLDFNDVTDVSPLSGHPSLRWLTLVHNPVRNLSLSDMPALEWLDLRANSIRNMSLSNLPVLTRLRLHAYLQIGVDDEYVFGDEMITMVSVSNMPALGYLGLGGNEIATLSLSDMPGLWYLGLSDNQLTRVSLPDMPALKELHLSRNHLTQVSLSDIPALERLRLENNQLTQVSLPDMPALDSLHLENNQLTQVSLSDMPALGRLHLANNQLTQVSLPDMPALRTLGLSRNQLTQVSLPDVPALEELYLSDNQLTQVLLSDLPALERLHLENNQLMQVSLSHLPALQRLSGLNGNNQLTEMSLSHMPALEELHLSDNQLTQVSVSDMSALEDLVLENNQLTGVSLSDLPALDHLNLNDNRIANIGFLFTIADSKRYVVVYLYRNPLNNRSLCSLRVLEDQGVSVYKDSDLYCKL